MSAAQVSAAQMLRRICRLTGGENCGEAAVDGVANGIGRIVWMKEKE
jgi:hypothetical protein